MKIRGTAITTPVKPEAVVDDENICQKPWSSKNTVERLCPSFTESGAVVQCQPVEGYPLEVVSTIDYKGDYWESITLTQSNGDTSTTFTVDFANLDEAHVLFGSYNWQTGVLDTGDDGIYQHDPETDTFTDIENIDTYVPHTVRNIYAVSGTNSFYSDCGKTTVLGRTNMFDDSKVGVSGWSSKNIVEKLCPSFTESGEWATCNPIEGSYLNIETKFRPIIPDGFAPSPDNRETIGAWSGGTLYHGSKNLVDLKAVENIKQLNFTGSDGKPTNKYTGFAFSLPDGTYTFRGEYAVDSNHYVGVIVNSADGAFKSAASLIWGTAKPATTITIGDGDIIYIYNGISGNTVATTQKMFKNNVNIMVEAGNTSSPYVPYNGNEITVGFGQNVYGGTYNWATGVLSIDVVGVYFDGSSDENWSFKTGDGSGKPIYYKYVNGMDTKIYLPKCDVLPHSTDAYYGKATSIYVNGTNLTLYVDGCTTEAEYRAFLEEHTPLFVYGLNAPTKVQLTPQEFVAISGANVCRSNLGETTVKGSESINSVIVRLTNAILALGGNV